MTTPYTSETTIANGTQYIQIRLAVYSPPQQSQTSIKINLNVLPPVPVFADDTLDVPMSLEIHAIPLPLTNSVISVVRQLLAGKIPSYFDQDRVGKTVLNFGNDYQLPIINWQYDTKDTSQATILVKTYSPLPDEIETLQELWIDRELSPSLLDQVSVVFVPKPSQKFYLRPPNKNVNVQNLHGSSVSNVTLGSLFTTGSFDKINPTDPILEEWFVNSLEGASLNIEYNNFSNFVFYSSANERITAFVNKLSLIENLQNVIFEQSSSLAKKSNTFGSFTSSLVYPAIQKIAEEKLSVIRSFDGYERFLYYGSGSAYSSSFTQDSDDAFYYLQDATWPKINGKVVSVASASGWISDIRVIATAYDRQNQNRLGNNLPDYLINDTNSSDFIKFIDLIGHHFDILKMYADGMPYIYDRNSDPSVGLSPDMIWTVAESFGITLPNQYAIKNLIDYTIGTVGAVGPKVYNQIAAETWKRFLHNHIFITKSKGTRAGLQALLNAYGILPTTIQIRETSGPSFYTSQSFELIEEQTNALDIPTLGYVSIPWSGSTITTASTLQIRFASTIPTQSILFNVDNQWSVKIAPVSQSNARLSIVSGSTIIAQTNLLSLFDGTFYSMHLQKKDNTVNLYVQQANDNGDIVKNETLSFTSPSTSIINSGSVLYLGGSGSSVSGVPFTGLIDEFRIWSEYLTYENIEFHTKYPALYNGNTPLSAKNNLTVRLSFNKAQNLGTSPFLINDSPYIRSNPVTGSLLTFLSSNFPNQSTYPYSMQIVNRIILRNSPSTGGSQYVSNKISIAQPPANRIFSTISGSSIPVLSHKQSIVPLSSKILDTSNNNIIGFFFSLTEAINDSIIRSLGNIDLQDYIGDPALMYAAKYNTLNDLSSIYWNDYAYKYNYNTFINFVENLLEPLFKQAKDLIPAKAKLLSGIVIQPHLLERYKVQWNPIDLSGKSTFNENDTPNLEANPVFVGPSVVSAEQNNLDSHIIANLISTVKSDNETYDVILYNPLQNGIVKLVSEVNLLTTKINTTTDVDTIHSGIFYYDDKSAELNYKKMLLRRFGATSILEVKDTDMPAFTQLMVTFKPKSTIGVATGINTSLPDNIYTTTIQPYTDFNILETRMYFTQKYGIFPVIVPTLVRADSAIISSAGTWTQASSYTKNQYVIQSSQVGSAAAGNNLEYVCVTPASKIPFISNNPPSLDPVNWRPMKYVTIPVIVNKIAGVVNGHVELTDPDMTYVPPFVGYSTKHYRFRRDKRLGTKRHQRLGCKNTILTTIDGGSPIEIISSAGDTLYVTTGAEPVQRTNDLNGPILDVK